MAFPQRLLQRRVQFGGGHVAVVEITVDKRAVHFHHLFHQRAVCGIHAAEVALALAVVEAVHHLRAIGGGQVQWQTLAAEGGLDVGQQRRQVHARCVYSVDDDEPVQVAGGGVVHHAPRHRLDAHGGVDHHRCRLHRLQRRQALAQKVGRAGRVDEVHAGAGVLQVHDGRVQRMLHPAFERVVIADRGATLQRAGCLQGPGLDQQRFGKTRFSGPCRPDQGQGADVQNDVQDGSGTVRRAARGWA